MDISSATITKSLEPIREAIRRAIRRGRTCGAVALVQKEGKIVFREAFGHRMLKPEKRRMTVTTIFDLASMTKVVATTMAAMLLLEEGNLRLNDKVRTYLPMFKARKPDSNSPRDVVTIKHLLTHSSGLPPWENYYKLLSKRTSSSPDPDDIIRRVCRKQFQAKPGERFIYSDLGFMLLAEIIKRVSGEPLDEFVKRRVYEPLGMKDTMFNPPKSLWRRCAATAEREGKMLCGVVHDENAFVLGGVGGHAGLFSTVDDLAIFAQMLLNGGSYNGVRILKTSTVELMTSGQFKRNNDVRGLGWDIDTGYSSPRGYLFPLGSYGHTGFTGTSLWIDPSSQTFVILLTNRLHPDGKGYVIGLRAEIATLAAASLGVHAKKYRYERQPTICHVLTGVDVLRQSNFRQLAGKRVGLITNQTGVDREGRSLMENLVQAEDSGVKLVALFSPEHGIRGNLDSLVPSESLTLSLEGKDRISRRRKSAKRLTVHSLYSEHRKPTPEMLKGIDALIFDIQDIGARFYTYATTMALCMESAAEAGIEFIVLDRPNPITGTIVEGPMLAERFNVLPSYHFVPVRHGLTMGEIAKFSNKEYGINCRLKIIKMRGWERVMWFDQTGLLWVNPSPNIRNLKQAILYPGIGCLESANISVGRGTDTPFEVLGAPWIDGSRLADALNCAEISGVSFTPITFTPTEREFKGERCGGVYIMLNDRLAFKSVAAAIRIASSIRRLWPNEFQFERTAHLFGDRNVPRAIANGIPPDEIIASWDDDIRKFKKRRESYLLYR